MAASLSAYMYVVQVVAEVLLVELTVDSVCNGGCMHHVNSRLRPTARDASGLAREPTYRLNFRGLLRQPT